MSGLTRFLMEQVEMPLVEVVAEMEDTGYPVDTQYIRDLRGRLEPEIDAALGHIRQSAGEDFNPKSPKQLSKLLFDKFGLKAIKWTPSGAPSTDSMTLERLKSEHTLIPHLIRFRQLDKILSTYCVIPDQIDVDGRLRVEFNQLAAETGRFSSGSVIQTLPKNDEFEIRKGFRAPEGFSIVGADFRQQELNVLAQVSGDKNLLEALAAGTDLHGLAAVRVFGLECQPNDVEEKYPEKRQQIKAIQFGLIYGKTAYGLADGLAITKEEAQKLIDDYFQQFPAVKAFIYRIHRDLQRQGYVEDVFGRRRHFPVLKERLPQKKYDHMNEREKKLFRAIYAAPRQAQNFVIQGASATITKLAMIRCHRRIAEKYPADVKMILTLHDELQFEVRDAAVSDFATELPELMCNLGLEKFGFKLPLSVEVKAGSSWGEMTKYDGGKAKDGQSTDTDCR
jgi:DNA polymerase-1